MSDTPDTTARVTFTPGLRAGGALVERVSAARDPHERAYIDLIGFWDETTPPPLRDDPDAAHALLRPPIPHREVGGLVLDLRLPILHLYDLADALDLALRALRARPDFMETGSIVQYDTLRRRLRQLAASLGGDERRYGQ